MRTTVCFPPCKHCQLLLALFLLPLSFITSSFAQQTTPITTSQNTIKVIAPEWPNWTNSDGSGFYFELIRAVYEDSHRKLLFDNANFMRSKVSAQNGDSDIVVGVFAKHHKDANLITPFYPIDNETFVIASKKAHRWQSLQDLNHQRLIIPRGYRVADDLPFKFTPVYVDSDLQGLKMLLANRERYLLTTEEEITIHLNTFKHTLDNFYIQEVIVSYIYLGFTNNTKGQTLADTYDQRLPQLIKEGAVESLYHKWQLKLRPLLQLPPPWQTEND